MNTAVAVDATPLERLHSLDGLRAVAVGLVVLHHLGGAALQPQLASGQLAVFGAFVAEATASGVELFFVLSAIVLVRPYASGHKALDLSSYLWRRAQRLYPPYWGAWLLSGLAIFLASAYPTWWTKGASLAEFSARDWLLQFGLIYVGHSPFNFAWWSLTVEVLFYALVPLLIPALISTRLASIRRASLFAASVLLATVAAVVTEPLVSRYSELLPPMRLLQYAPCFCAGLLLAQQRLTTRQEKAVIVLGVCWVAAHLQFRSLNQHVGWGMIYFGIASIAMNRQSQMACRLSSDLMIWIGERSYSIFLTHFAVIGLVCHFVSLQLEIKGLAYFAATRPLSVVLSLAAGMLLFHFTERKFARNLMTATNFWPPLPGSSSIRNAQAVNRQRAG